VRDAQGLQHVVGRDGVDGVAQRQVNAHQHGAQLVAGQHHAHRHLSERHARMRCRLRLQQLGVARIVHASGVQRLLVQRRGHQAGNLPAQRRLGRPHHALRSSAPAFGRYSAKRQGAGQTGKRQHRQTTRRHLARLRRRGDDSHRQIRNAGAAHASGRAPQRGELAHDEGALHLVRRIAECFGNDLRSDARRVALGDGQKRERVLRDGNHENISEMGL
jgi:hypothetical protein